MTKGRTHVVGAGLAGLSAAVALAAAGRPVSLYEAANRAGGRCRSYVDAELGCRLDNGNHLLLSGNRSALAYLETIGASATMIGQSEPDFPFLDRATGERWHLRPGRSRLPWWIFDRRRVPATSPLDYVAVARLALAGPDRTVADVLDTGSPAFRRLWQPLAVAALNTQPEEGAAALLWPVLRETFGRGGRACLPLVPREGLSESFVDPALRFLDRRGTTIRFGARLRRLEIDDAGVAVLGFEAEAVALDPGDGLVLAVPPWIAAQLVPGLVVPDSFRAILNAHYRYAAPSDAPFFIGLVGGVAEWVFRKEGVLSVTISAAERCIDRPAEELAHLLWHDVAAAYELGARTLPPWRIVKEKRATFAATPTQERRRPGPITRWPNLVLAGDWTRTGLPATIESAIRSGAAAAAAIIAGRAGSHAEKKLERAGNTTHVALRSES